MENRSPFNLWRHGSIAQPSVSSIDAEDRNSWIPFFVQLKFQVLVITPKMEGQLQLCSDSRSLLARMSPSNNSSINILNPNRNRTIADQSCQISKLTDPGDRLRFCSVDLSSPVQRLQQRILESSLYYNQKHSKSLLSFGFRFFSRQTNEFTKRFIPVTK